MVLEGESSFLLLLLVESCFQGCKIPSHVSCKYLILHYTHIIQAVESYDDEKRARLLQFVTGSSRVPLEGFKALQGERLLYTQCHSLLHCSCSKMFTVLLCIPYMVGSTGAVGPRLFTIHLVDILSTDSLPKAHTW